ncbi:AP-4 complex accessory subunit tepsin isoform X6 [Macaca nemestrina]|uniref:AP-4 complex accessory subunit tepsin isoform X6 n=1 Tax=Macaca nemestrina TaxID=9545 RepID=UPI0039B85908
MGTARPWGNEQASASIQWAPTGGKERRTQWTWSRCVRAAGAQLPILLKGTSDDDVPCPGYLFEEIAKISHESPGSSQCLLEYLLSRLHSSSGHGKLKVLKILLYLCGHGSSSFLLILKRNSAFIQEAAAFAGPPDPLHGNSLYQKVRAAAQDLGSTLFSDTVLPLAPSQPLGNPPATGMGSQARPHGTLQGFGYSKEHGRTGAGSAGEAFLSTIQKAAEVVASAMRPGPESPSTQRLLPRGDTYQPATMPSANHGPPTLGNPLPGAIPGPRGIEARAPPLGVWVTPSCHRWGFAAMEANPRASHTAGGDGTRGGSRCPLGLVFAEAGAKVAGYPSSAQDSVPKALVQGPGRWAWGWPEALGISPAILFPPAMRHQPGQAGGGWDELDSSPSSQNSSQNSDLSRVSDSGSHSGSDSHSGASREPGDLAERVEVVALSDCQQELSLVRTVTRGPCAFLSREEAQHFLKACGLLNCEAVLQLLTCHLRGTKGPVCHCLPGERRPPSPGAHPPPHPAAAAGAQHGQPGTCDQQGHQGGQLQSATHTRVQGYSRTYTAVHGHPVPARRLVSPSRTRLPSPCPAGRGSSSESGSSPPHSLPAFHPNSAALTGHWPLPVPGSPQTPLP